MLHALSVWFLAAGLLGAGLFNAIGTSTLRSSFVRWGFPWWWCRVTGAIEIVAAVLVALPAGRVAGLTLGTAVIGVAIVIVLRHREYSHLVPLGIFVVLLALAGMPS